ncbi:MAG: recombinase family protein [Clostridiales bacterium]|nr:MAG: recombinase family protein [Clostridiales bacterium]
MRYGCTQTEGSGSCSKINRKSDIEVNDNMEIPESIRPPRVVRVIPPTINTQESIREKYKQLRVVAYCRVSTKQEEQLNSYETQKNYYTEKINAEPNWTLAGIFADKGITGTSIKKRDEFKKMIRLCRQGKVDMIITKSISRFARNTVDCLVYIRKLKEMGVDVFFEEQGIHSTQPGAEFYITIYGSIAQSESENISANVKWGKEQSAREGKVAFHYKNFLGFRKGEDGRPEIVPEQAQVIQFIYDSFLSGDSIGGIKDKLEELRIPSPSGKAEWHYSTIQSILKNEKYKGDGIINKTYIEDCISKKVRLNNGERVKFYVENNHEGIISSEKYALVQEELARRTSKPKIKQKGTKTEQGKYSSKYALTELLVCGECKTPYRRCTWTMKGQKKIVWRCINRLDYGKKYCHKSPTIEESVLQCAIMKAIGRTAMQNAEVLRTLKLHIGMGLDMSETEDKSLDIQIRIAEIEAEFKAMLNAVSSETLEAFDEGKATVLMNEKNNLQQQLAQIAERKQKRANVKTRLDDIFTILDGLKNHPMEYDDRIVRQIIECIVVESKEQIKIVFVGGLEVLQELENRN